MKKIDFGQSIQILANVGVIAGVAFLALEISQNNKLLRADADYNYHQGREENRLRIATDPEYAEFWAKVIHNEIETDVDKVRLTAHIEATTLAWEYEYSQVVEGNFIDDRDAVIERWRATLQAGDAFATEFPRVWSSLRPTLRDDFVEFIEENVISP